MINLDKKQIDFIGHRKAFLVASLCLVIIALLALGLKGLNLSSEFVGGSTITYINTTDETSKEDVAQALSDAGYEGENQVQAMSSNGVDGFLARIDTTNVEDAENYAMTAAEKLGVSDNDVQVSTIGPNWGADVLQSMVLAAIIAIILVLTYIAIRFRDLKMGVIAILDMAFDVIVTLGIIAIISIFYNFTLSPAVVGSLLTVAAYSTYDVVVSFRSIEDTKDTVKNQGYMTIVNNAINKVIVRSMNTTLTTLIPVLMMLILGGTTLTDFALAIFVGIIVGGFSTIGLAVPLYAIWRSHDLEPAKLNVKYGIKVNTDTSEVMGYLKGPDDIPAYLEEVREAYALSVKEKEDARAKLRAERAAAAAARAAEEELEKANKQETTGEDTQAEDSDTATDDIAPATVE